MSWLRCKCFGGIGDDLATSRDQENWKITSEKSQKIWVLRVKTQIFWLFFWSYFSVFLVSGGRQIVSNAPKAFASQPGTLIHPINSLVWYKRSYKWPHIVKSDSCGIFWPKTLVFSIFSLWRESYGGEKISAFKVLSPCIYLGFKVSWVKTC